MIDSTNLCFTSGNWLLQFNDMSGTWFGTLSWTGHETILSRTA